MRFVVKGRTHEISRESVEQSMVGAKPEPVRQWAVEVNGHAYPVKQVFAAATGLARGDFISTVAQDKLARLGFSVYAASGGGCAPRADEDGRSELAVLVDAVREIELGAISAGAEEYGYPNLVLCLIDAIFSIGMRYTTTRRVVEHFKLWWDSNVDGLSASDSRLSVADFASQLGFVTELDQPGARAEAKRVFGNLNLTSPRGGILKAIAVVEAAQALLSFGIEDKSDLLEHYSDSEFTDAFRSIRGQSSGVSLRYLFMLAGREEEAKPDRMILRFLERHLGYRPRPEEAVALLSAVTDELRKDGLNMSVRDLDHAIWRTETSNPGPVETPARPASKYAPLGDYLASLNNDRVELTFERIEEIIAAPLPPSARNHAAFWANHYGGTHVWATAWMDAGWRVDSYSLAGERVVFLRTATDAHGCYDS